jgi:hypothetical protein
MTPSWDRFYMAVAIVLALAGPSWGERPAGNDDRDAPPRVPSEQSRPAVEKAFISFRIGPPQWMPENRYGELLSLFEKYKGVTDEITRAI